MPRVCSVCVHPHREEIDALLIESHPFRAITRQFPDLSKDAVRRHAAAHLPKALARAQDVQETVQAGTLLDRLRQVNAETLAVLAEAKQAHDGDLRLRALARLEKQIELEGALLGELQAGTTVQVAVGVQTPAVDTESEPFRQAVYDAMAAWVKQMPPSLQAEIVGWLRAVREQRLQARVAAAEERQRLTLPPGYEAEQRLAAEPPRGRWLPDES